MQSNQIQDININNQRHQIQDEIQNVNINNQYQHKIQSINANIYNAVATIVNIGQDDATFTNSTKFEEVKNF